MEDPQALHRNMVIDMEYNGTKYKDKGIAIKMSETPGTIRMMPPTQGQHTDEILAELGYDSEQIAQLREKGVIR